MSSSPAKQPIQGWRCVVMKVRLSKRAWFQASVGRVLEPEGVQGKWRNGCCVGPTCEHPCCWEHIGQVVAADSSLVTN